MCTAVTNSQSLFQYNGVTLSMTKILIFQPTIGRRKKLGEKIQRNIDRAGSGKSVYTVQPQSYILLDVDKKLT